MFVERKNGMLMICQNASFLLNQRVAVNVGLETNWFSELITKSEGS